jgi:urea transport system ATP-binding protein
MGIKYLTQDAQIFPHFTVKENLLFALNYNKHLFNDRVKDILKLFPDMEKNNFLNIKGHELSGGQKEKIAIAMVLITHPRLLLLDEPSTGLSPNLVNTLLKGIREFQENLMGNMGVILIEQQRLFDARKICDGVYLLKNGITIGLNGKPSSEKLKNDMVTDDQLEEFMLVEA